MVELWGGKYSRIDMTIAFDGPVRNYSSFQYWGSDYVSYDVNDTSPLSSFSLQGLFPPPSGAPPLYQYPASTNVDWLFYRVDGNAFNIKYDDGEMWFSRAMNARSLDDWLGTGPRDINGGYYGDILLGGPKADKLEGFGGIDRISAGAGNDEIDGGSGTDILEGGAGSDTYVLGNGKDNIIDSAGVDDTITTTISRALSGLYTEVENLTLLGAAARGSGNSLDNTILGTARANQLFGLGGNDTFVGERGRDVMDGGPGRDVFKFGLVADSRPGASRDVINGFQRGADKIDLRAVDAASTSYPANEQFYFLGSNPFSKILGRGELRFIDQGSQCIVQGDVNADGRADFEILVKAATLSKSDFIL